MSSDNEYMREWRKRNPEKVKEYKRVWELANPEKFKEMTFKSRTKWRSTHLELARARKNACHKANPQKQHDARRAWRKAHPEENRKRSRIESRLWKIRKKYGLTIEQYEEIVRKQENLCATCRLPNTSNKDWRIDHCHKTNRVRGLLCNKCNFALGLVGDNIEILLRMAEYLDIYSNEECDASV